MKSPLPYLGGKSRVAKKLITMIPHHQTSVELFCGGASFTLAKEPAKCEVINDLSQDVAIFFRVCQFHYEELVRYIKFSIISRTWFETLKRTDPANLTDIQRSFRFLYLQKNSFGGRIVNPSYHYFRSNKSNFNPLALQKQIETLHHRLARVQVECLPYQQVIQKFDSARTFFFADPPYNNRPFYQFNFEISNYLELAKQLGSIKGKFLMTLNDDAEMRKIFSHFQISTIEFPYTCLKQQGRRFTELLIKNY